MHVVDNDEEEARLSQGTGERPRTGNGKLRRRDRFE
jgi:hypothetical protein